MGRRILNEALRKMVNADKRGMATAQLQPISNVMVGFLNIMKERGYIKGYQVFDPQRVGKITVELQGRITDCKAIMYRQDIQAHKIKDYTTRTLPTQQWGYVVITTPNGILDHEEAMKQNVGGQVLGFFH
ncbi:40S ribosomal protein S15a-2 [Acorus gramineus]|uniref:Small ribosomal subunit protein uS8c n=1 Tax=Acorus gramineus TaxID=55184 RepID=A0AAV9ANB9_ACOGR|nr:40S ribosomal protein S15a-2 [Acorus gramineus]